MSSHILSGMQFSLVIAVLAAGCGDDVGKPCFLGVDAGQSQAAVNREALECTTHLCLKPALATGQTTFVPPTGPTCSVECSADSDCLSGQLRDRNNSGDTRCKTGFACAVPIVSGPLCCRKLCTCKDFLGPTGTQVPAACQGEKAKSCASP